MLGVERPEIGVLADDVVDAAGLSGPLGVVPRPADGGDIGQPRQLRGEALELVEVAELARAARALDDEELVLAGELPFSPVLPQRAHVADVRCDAGHGREQEMVGAAARRVEREAAFGDFPRIHRVARPEPVEERRELALRHQLEEELDLALVWRRDDRIRPFDQSLAVVDAERGVLAWSEVELPSGIDADHPEVVGEVDASRDADVEELLGGRDRHQAYLYCSGRPDSSGA